MRELRVGVLLLALCTCGSSIEESRLISAPAKSPQCKIEFVVVGRDDVKSDGTYEIVGHVVLIESRIEEPFTPARRAKVRPRACALGGEAVALEAMRTGVLALTRFRGHPRSVKRA
jgi:hypothetical protein